MKKTEKRGKAQLMALLRQAAHRHTLYDVFRDFCSLSAISISNAVDLAQREPREAEYMRIIKRYEDQETRALFPQMLCAVVDELEDGFSDVLGSTFMELELGNKATGQFFTPYSLSQAIAQMTAGDDMAELIENNGFVTVNDPAVGGGALPIAFCEALKGRGINYQRFAHITAQDVDPRSAHMAYVQLSLIHAPALVIVGNTLTMEQREFWYTPAHILGGWNWKLRRKELFGSEPLNVEVAAVPVATLPPAPPQQMTFSLDG